MSVEAWNATLKMSDTAEGSYTAVAEVYDVTGGGITNNTVEDTTIGNRFATYAVTGSTQEPITFMVNCTYASHSTLMTLSQNPTMKYWEWAVVGGYTYRSAGILTNFVPGASNRSDRLTASFTIRTSGPPTISAGPSAE